MGTLEELNAAFAIMKAVNVLDVTPEGVKAWENAYRSYETRVDRVEAYVLSVIGVILQSNHCTSKRSSWKVKERQ